MEAMTEIVKNIVLGGMIVLFVSCMALFWWDDIKKLIKL